ncbi:geranylgeranylglycerol-phosphate geranylgeranyltransferase [Sungkyunkwania multivorans]|uniref:Geranylgeranylglycerol-phosphate geranylgeranyltransferase n=1 Tax=Sungkyunkwania multivorans TaxID=1173618 RepID=A0ABW3CWX0_9FLAO
MLPILNLIRYPNLLIIAATQYVFKYFVVDPMMKASALNDWQFALLVLATICIAAAGNIINDINDVNIDLINKPKKVIVSKSISESLANNLFIGFNVVGVVIGLYLSNTVGKNNMAVIFVLISGLLYIYSTSLKKLLLVGNLLVSALVGFSILIVGLFEIYPMIDEHNLTAAQWTLKVLAIYALFAFLVNLLREITKDIEDIDGDYGGGMNTLPILLGRERTAKLVAVLGMAVMVVIFLFVYKYLYDKQGVLSYILLFVFGPLFYFVINSWNAKKKQDFRKLSTVLKVVMLFGIFSVIVLYYAFKETN